MKTDVYISGENGYNTYRIPALLAAWNGYLLAICEGRRNTPRDYGDIDLLIKRSSNGGATWSAQQVIYGEPGDDITIGNPCPVLDHDTGVIWLPFCRNNRDVLITSSDDHGETWSTPRDLNATCRNDAWNWYATGPGIGIQLMRGPHEGRLVIPCDHRHDDDYGNGSHALLSDDHGETWRRSGLIKHGANECQVAELMDGMLMMNIRMQTLSQGLRGVSLSEDGGETWSEVVHESQLPCPKCQASLIGNGDTYLFSNPVPPHPPNPEKGDRVNLVVKQSTDQGKTWNDHLVLHEGPAAYSSLLFHADGDAACLYEGGTDDFRDGLIFQRFPLA